MSTLFEPMVNLVRRIASERASKPVAVDHKTLMVESSKDVGKALGIDEALIEPAETRKGNWRRLKAIYPLADSNLRGTESYFFNKTIVYKAR